jgi:hypothetical protein
MHWPMASLRHVLKLVFVRNLEEGRGHGKNEVTTLELVCLQAAWSLCHYATVATPTQCASAVMEPISCVRPLCDLLTVTDVFAVRTVLYTLDKLIHRIQPG